MKPARSLSTVIQLSLCAACATGQADPRDDKPAVTRNFSQEINAKVLAVPEADRAWPRYRDASLRLTEPVEGSEFETSENRRPGDRNWQQLVQASVDNRQVLDDIRAASRLPHFGFLISDAADESLTRIRLAKEGKEYEPQAREENPRVVDFRYECLGTARRLARRLACDARAAVTHEDAPRAVEDILAMLRLAHHIREIETGIGDLVACSIVQLAGITVSDVVQLAPDAPDHEQLLVLQLAFEKEIPPDGVLLARPELDRVMMLDALQRCFADDGHDDGRLTWQGIDEIQAMGGQRDEDGLRAILGSNPIFAREFWREAATRRESLAEFDRIVADPVYREPMWEWTEEMPEVPGIDLENKSAWGSKYVLVGIVKPPIHKAARLTEQFRQELQGIATSLALERFRKLRGVSPATLDQLVPEFLQSVPLDRITREPLRYQSTETGFILYSVGVDRDDDHGRPTPERENAWQWVLRDDEQSRDPSRDGDWVLWPKP